MEKFRNFIFTLITLFVFILWFIPVFMIYHGYRNEWGFLYLPIIGISFLWGLVIANTYSDYTLEKMNLFITL